MYNVGAGLPRHLMAHDVLTGCTTWTGENTTNDMAKAARRAAVAVRMALDSSFFAEIGTHEQKIGVLSLDEIDRWLTLLKRETQQYETRLVGHERAAEYTKARDESWISSASTPDGQRVVVSMQGNSDLSQELALFEDERGEIVQTWKPISPFQGALQIDL